MKPLVKKAVQAKSKLKKSGSSQSQKTQSDNSSGNDASSSSNKEKINYRNYAGLSSKSIKSIWEQHDKNETEVLPEVYSKLSEDVTYKIWELANNIKTYASHSSGKVTYDLVNDILKDCNVPPVVGANDSPWDKIEYDGAYFFNTDTNLDLSKEYTQDLELEQQGEMYMSSAWMTQPDSVDDLMELFNNICDAVFVGDDECYQEALKIATENPHIGSLLKLFISKCVEMLAFEYTEDTLRRTLKFISALTRNSTSMVDMPLELSLLGQLFVHLLLGPPPIKFDAYQTSSIMNLEQTTDHYQADSVPTHNLDNISPLVFEDSQNAKDIKIKNDCEADININTIKDEFEDLFSQVFGLKTESNDDISSGGETQIKAEFDPMDSSMQGFMDQSQSASINEQIVESTVLTTNEDQTFRGPVRMSEEDDNVSVVLSLASTVEEAPKDEPLDHENITTLICNNYLIDEVCETLGLCCAKWGFVEQECTYLMVDRIQSCFQEQQAVQIDYAWLMRMIRGLWSIGEFPFRELTGYFDQIDVHKIPEILQCYFNSTAIFLRGKSDRFLYEYLNELCGDSVHPFMLYYNKFLDRFSQKLRERVKAPTDEKFYKISPKILLKSTVRDGKIRQLPRIQDQFEHYQTIATKKPMRKFAFRFAGCRPFNVKARKLRQPVPPQMDATRQNKELLDHFNRRIVVAKRKNLKPLTNYVKENEFMNYKNIQI